MIDLKQELVNRGLNYTNLDTRLKEFVTRSDHEFRALDGDKRDAYVEKFISILARAQKGIQSLSTEIGKKRFDEEAKTAAVMLQTGIESPEAYDIRKKLYRLASLDENPSKNGVAGQITMAVIDEFIISLGDLAVQLIQVLDDKGIGYLLKEIKNLVLSGDTWKAIAKELGDGLYDLVFDWNGDDDFLYKKTRSVVIALGLAALLKKIGVTVFKKLTKQVAKKAGADVALTAVKAAI